MEHGHFVVTGGVGWWVLGIIAGILLVALTVYLILKLFGAIPSPKQMSDIYYNTDGTSASAKEILDKRYCSGDIDKEEYERLKKDIESKS